MFKGLGNLASLLRNAQDIGGRIGEVTEKLKTQRAKGSAGGGMVEVEVNGLGQVLQVKIDPMLVEQGEQEMIQTLLPAAINQATGKAKQMHLEAMKEMTGGFELPGLHDTLNEMVGQDINGGDPEPGTDLDAAPQT